MLIEHLENKYEISNTRGYIGCSSIGHPCMRYVWLQKNGKDIPFYLSFNKKRIFERGQLEEKRLIDSIKGIEGFKIISEQYHVETDFLSGNIDAILEDSGGTQWVLEFKTCNKSSFERLLRHGVQKIYPTYYVQIQTYMSLSGIHNGIFLFVNKNDEKLYEETVTFNKEIADRAIERAKTIDSIEKMPAGFADLKSKPFECNFCSFENFCWGEGGHEDDSQTQS